MTHMSANRADPSSFFRLNEEVAAELARLDREGALDRLKELLGAGELELWVSSARPAEGLEEPVGVLRSGEAGEAPLARPLAPAPTEVREGCGCGPGEGEGGETGEASAHGAGQAAAAGGFDSHGVLPVRSRFTVQWPDGSAGEVYMPDHICPACWNEAGNHIDACRRVCGSCGFGW